MTKTKFKNLKKGDKVISKIIPTITYVVSKKHEDSYTVTHSLEMTNPEAWDLIKEKRDR